MRDGFAGRLRGINVLVVENTNEVRTLYEEILVLCEAAVITAGSPEDALFATSAFVPDIVITDLTFGGRGRDGLWLLAQLRSTPMLRESRIVAITARQLDAAWRRKYPFDAVLTKPVEIEHVITVVEQLGRKL